MVVNKPSIYIYVNNPNENVLREICSGIEEEDSPFLKRRKYNDSECLGDFCGFPKHCF